MPFERTTPLDLAILVLVCLNNIEASHYPIGGVYTGVNAQTGARPATKISWILKNIFPLGALNFIHLVYLLQEVKGHQCRALL